MAEVAEETVAVNPTSATNPLSSLPEYDEDSETLSEVKRRLRNNTPEDRKRRKRIVRCTDNGDGYEDENDADSDEEIHNGHSTVNGGDCAISHKQVNETPVEDGGGQSTNGEVLPEPDETEANEMIDVVIQEISSGDENKEKNHPAGEELHITFEECADDIDVTNVEEEGKQKDEARVFVEEEVLYQETGTEQEEMEDIVLCQEEVITEEVTEEQQEDSVPKNTKTEESGSFASSISNFLEKFSPGRREEPEVSSSKRDSEPPSSQEPSQGSSQPDAERPQPMFFSTVRGRRGVSTPERALLGISPGTEFKAGLTTPLGKVLDDSFVVRSEPPRWTSTWRDRSLHKSEGKRALNTEEGEDEQQLGKRRRLEATGQGFLERWSPFKKRRVNIEGIIPKSESPSRFSWIYNRFGWKKVEAEEALEEKTEKEEASMSESASEGTSRGCTVM